MGKKASVKWRFGNGESEQMPLDDLTERLISQYAAMVRSDSPELREMGTRRMNEVARATIAGQFAEHQRQKAGFSSASERSAERRPEWDKWQARADEIYAANPHQSLNQISIKVAAEFGVSSRIVSKRISLK